MVATIAIRQAIFLFGEKITSQSPNIRREYESFSQAFVVLRYSRRALYKVTADRQG
jgi:hypothetical protein